MPPRLAFISGVMQTAMSWGPITVALGYSYLMTRSGALIGSASKEWALRAPAPDAGFIIRTIALPSAQPGRSTISWTIAVKDGVICSSPCAFVFHPDIGQSIEFCVNCRDETFFTAE